MKNQNINLIWNFFLFLFCIYGVYVYPIFSFSCFMFRFIFWVYIIKLWKYFLFVFAAFSFFKLCIKKNIQSNRFGDSIVIPNQNLVRFFSSFSLSCFCLYIIIHIHLWNSLRWFFRYPTGMKFYWCDCRFEILFKLEILFVYWYFRFQYTCCRIGTSVVYCSLYRKYCWFNLFIIIYVVLGIINQILNIVYTKKQ